MRKSISTAFFSLVSTLMVLGIVLMGCSEWVLFKNYFARDRYETLDQVVGVTQRTARYLAGRPEHQAGDHRRECRGLSVFHRQRRPGVDRFQPGNAHRTGRAG